METGHPSTRAVNSGSGNRALVIDCYMIMTHVMMTSQEWFSCLIFIIIIGIIAGIFIINDEISLLWVKL